jgi:glycosyltransferase involved in cell wall biosynthesis
MKKEKLKIAVFHLAFIYSGGGEKLVLEEVRGLEKKGHQVSVFTSVLDKRECYPDIIDQFKIQTFLPNLPTFLPQWEVFQVLFVCVLAPLLARRFKNFEVILAANQPSPWLAFWVKKFFGVPYVSYLSQPTRFLHLRKIDRQTGLVFAREKTFTPASFLMKIAKPLANWADQASIKGSNLVLADGDYVKKLLKTAYKIKAVCCPAAASPTKKQPNFVHRYQGKLKVAGKLIFKPYLLLTNRHFPQKKFEDAIAALPAILKKFPKTCLVITGKKTDYTQKLKILIKRLVLEKNVLFLGLVKEKDLERLYSQAAVYIYTAPEEDFGMGVVEAMAHSTPVVAWKKAGPATIVVDGQTGFLAKPLSVADFTAKILKLLANQKLARRFGQQALKRVKKWFSYDQHLKLLETKLKETAWEKT